jgi:hypothetical protein
LAPAVGAEAVAAALVAVLPAALLPVALRVVRLLPQQLDLLLDKLDWAVVAVLRVVRAQLVVEAAALLLVQGLVASESLRSR